MNMETKEKTDKPKPTSFLCTCIPSHLGYCGDSFSSVGEPCILIHPLLQNFALKVTTIFWLVTATVGSGPGCVPTVVAQGFSQGELHLGYKIKALQEIA